MPVEFINPSELSQGTYSHVAAVSGGARTLYVSGQVAMDAAGKVIGQNFAEQAEQVLRNLGIALAAGGAQFHHIVKMNVYVRDLTSEKVKTLRAIRQRHFGAPSAREHAGRHDRAGARGSDARDRSDRGPRLSGAREELLARRFRPARIRSQKSYDYFR